MLTPPHRERLIAGAQALGVDLTAEQVDLLARHCSLLGVWNRRINLTRITDPQHVVDHHLLDCLALVPLLPHRTTLLDIGSGGGFPGAVVAVARPDLDVTLWEATGKKVAFLTALVAELGLRCRVEHRRSTAGPRPTAPFDTVVSRATMPLSQWLTHGADFVAPGGRLLAMVAHQDPPLPTLPSWETAAAHGYSLPSGESRWVLCWRRPA